MQHMYMYSIARYVLWTAVRQSVTRLFLSQGCFVETTEWVELVSDTEAAVGLSYKAFKV